MHKGSLGSLFWPEFKPMVHPVREPLLPYSPYVVKHSAVFRAIDRQKWKQCHAFKLRREAL